MVNISELRVGNIVAFNDRVEIVHDIIQDPIRQMDRINSYSVGPDGKNGVPVISIYPIPLTRKYMEECLKDDFKAVGNKLRYMSIYFMEIEFKPADRIDITIDSKASTVKIKRSKAKHLHLLQNLFHAITGSEMHLVNQSRLPIK